MSARARASVGVRASASGKRVGKWEGGGLPLRRVEAVRAEHLRVCAHLPATDASLVSVVFARVQVQRFKDKQPRCCANRTVPGFSASVPMDTLVCLRACVRVCMRAGKGGEGLLVDGNAHATLCCVHADVNANDFED